MGWAERANKRMRMDEKSDDIEVINPEVVFEVSWFKKIKDFICRLLLKR